MSTIALFCDNADLGRTDQQLTAEQDTDNSCERERKKTEDGLGSPKQRQIHRQELSLSMELPFFPENQTRL